MSETYHRALQRAIEARLTMGNDALPRDIIQHNDASDDPMTTNQRRDHVYRTDALIIGRLDLGEVDRILTLFTPQHGKLRAIAKGVRRPQSRLAPHLELFSESRVMLAKGRDLDVVTSAEMLDAHWPLRGDLEAFGHASYLVELLNLFTQDRQENRRAYDLLSRSLRLLGEGVDPYAVTRHYELALLDLVGFRPRLYQCVGCDEEIVAEANALSLQLGGLLCPRCRPADLSAPALSINAQKYIRVLDRDGLAGAVKLRLDPATAGEVERALSSYARHHAERESRSLGVLKSIREWRPPYDVAAAGDQRSTK
jgi:DNA repair protein RecO (recombination protein O)